MLKSDTVTRVIVFLIILTSSAFANCKDYYNLSEDKIQNIDIKVDKERKFIKRLNKFYVSSKKGEDFNFNKKKNLEQKLLLTIVVVIIVFTKPN